MMMSSAARAVARAFEKFPTDSVIDVIDRLVQLDRFQASFGIEKAADLVAETAECVGLSDVRIQMFKANGLPSWWSYAAPRSWTPLHAALDLVTPTQVTRLAEYPRQAMVLATYSAPMPRTGGDAPAADSLPLADILSPGVREHVRGSVVLVPAEVMDQPGFPPPRLLIEELERLGAAGFVTDVASRRLGQDATASGRVELAPHTEIFGFSVPPRVVAGLREQARVGARVRVRVSVDRSARMPVVHGVLPAAGTAPEILLQAHLCHPRPSAYDNGSGVAALLGIAAALAGAGDSADAARAVRFLWCPEFSGTAAYLHDVVDPGDLPKPGAVFNLDMVGEDQEQCGGPLTIEGPPAHVASFLPALADEFLHLLPPRARSYSDSVGLPDSAWAEVPFCGASDHMLFGDPSVGVQAVSFGHWPHRFRHTSLDTADRISRDELRGVGAVVGGLASYLRYAGSEAVPFIRTAVARWSADQIARISRIAASREPAAITEPIEGREVFDPFGRDNVAAFLRHQADRGQTALDAARIFFGVKGPVEADDVIGGLLTDHARAFAWLIGSSKAERAERTDGTSFQRSWPGPFNFEGLISAAEADDRSGLIEQDHRSASAYSVMVALALASSHESRFQDIVRAASYSTWLSIDIAMARRYIGILLSTGWVTSHPFGGNLNREEVA
jgi:hypothetical protein